MFINSGVTNQGIKGYTDRLARIFPANSITIDFFGNAYYRSEPYKLATHNHVFSFYGGALSDENVGLYLVGAMSYLPEIYSYGNMATKPTLKDNQIILPSSTSGMPDYNFMRRYIATLKAERVATLKAYLLAAGLSDTILAEGELAALDALRQNHVNWKEIPVCGKYGAFNVSNTHSILKAQVVPGSGDIPYVGAGESNNSIQSYISISPDLVEKGNSIMIGGKTLVITYQEKDYASNDSHNLALYYKDIENPSRTIQLFLVSALYRALKPKYHWGDSISNKKIKSDRFMLPTNRDGMIDYDFINNLISAQIKLCIKEVLSSRDLEISTTEKVIDSDLSYFENNTPISMAAEPFEIYQWPEVSKENKNRTDTILVGCWRDKKQLEWIFANNLYNIRLGKRKGSAEDKPECFGLASLLYLYDAKHPENVSVFKIVDHQEKLGTELKEMDYPRKSPGKSYMTFKIEAQAENNKEIDVDVAEILGNLSNHVNGAPVFIEPTESKK